MKYSCCMLLVVLLTNMVMSLQPCAKGQTTNCTPNRFKPCDTIKGDYKRFRNENHDCGSNGGIEPYSTEQHIVQFQGDDGCLEILMYAGECWGNQYRTGLNYDCQGRCGGSCGGNKCSNWGADCLRHDVCSYYYAASDRIASPNCGYEYLQAVDDTGTYCIGPRRNSCESRKDSLKDNRRDAICAIRSV